MYNLELISGFRHIVLSAGASDIHFVATRTTMRLLSAHTIGLQSSDHG